MASLVIEDLPIEDLPTAKGPLHYFSRAYLEECTEVPGAKRYVMRGPLNKHPRNKGNRLSARLGPRKTELCGLPPPSRPRDLVHLVYKKHARGVEIMIICTAKEATGRGLGAAMIASLKKNVIAKTYFALALPGSEAFWSSVGFVQCRDKDRRITLMGADEVPNNARLVLYILKL